MQSGELPEFEILLTEQIYQSAWGYCCRLSASREDAQDLLQEGLLRAYRSLDQLRSPEHFKPWLFTLLRRLWVSKGRRYRPPLVDSFLVREQAARDPDMLPPELAEAFERLPEAQRELLALAYIDDLSLEELGRLLMIPPGAVAQRLHRARAALRRSYCAIAGLDAAPEVK